MSYKQQQVLIGVLAGVILAGFVLFRYMPLQKKMKSVEQARAEQLLAVSQASKQREQLTALKEQLRQLQRELEDFERKVPSHKNLGVFLQEIANLMNTHNLHGQMIQPNRDIKAENVNCIPLKIQCKGKLRQIFGFYKSLQEIDRLVRIGQIKLKNDRNFNGEVSMETKAVIYYTPQAGEG